MGILNETFEHALFEVNYINEIKTWMWAHAEQGIITYNSTLKYHITCKFSKKPKLATEKGRIIKMRLWYAIIIDIVTMLLNKFNN